MTTHQSEQFKLIPENRHTGTDNEHAELPKTRELTATEIELIDSFSFTERREIERELFFSPVSVKQLKEIGLDKIKATFLTYRGSSMKDERAIWSHVIQTLDQINQGELNDNDIIRPLQNSEDELYVNKLQTILDDSPTQKELKERGFENLDEVKITNISIDQILKAPIHETHQADITIISELALQVQGSIEIDSVLLNTGPTTYPWKSEILVQNDPSGQIMVKDALASTALDKEVHPDDIDFLTLPKLELNTAIDFGDEALRNDQNSNLKDTRMGIPLTKRNLDILDQHKLQEKFPEGVSEYSNSVGTYMTKMAATMLSQYIKHYIEREFNLRTFTDRKYFGTSFELNSEVSTLSQEKIDALYIQGIETGIFDPILLYLGKGAKEFINITQGEHYKITSAEYMLIQEHINELADLLEHTNVYELGPGDAQKTKLILEELAQRKGNSSDTGPISYHPVDISPTMIYAAAESLQNIEGVQIQGHVKDFRNLDQITKDTPNSILFLGGTLGNVEQEEQIEIMKNIGAAVKPGERVVVGIDLKQDLDKLIDAYKNPESEIFAKQVLEPCNIKPSDIEYDVIPDYENNQLVMKLIFKQDIVLSYKGHEKKYSRGESVRHAISHKYEVAEINELAEAAELTVTNQFTNPDNNYLLVVFEKPIEE